MNSLFTFYKAGGSEKLFYSQVIPANGQIVALEQQIMVTPENSDDDPEEAKSDYSPSAVFFDKKYFIFYKSDSNNDVLYSQSGDCLTWSGNTAILNASGNEIQTSNTPASVVFNDNLYLVYKAGAHKTIYISAYTGGTKWLGDKAISDIKTDKSPSAVAFNYQEDSSLYLFYKGEGSNRLYSANYTISADTQPPSDPTTWSWEGNDPIKVAGEEIQTSESPACTVYNGKLYLIYKAGGSNHLYFAYSPDGKNWYGDNRIKVGNTEIQSDNSPSCCVLDHEGQPRLCVIYKAGGSDDIYSAYSDNGMTWYGNAKVYGIQTNVGPNYLQHDIETTDFRTNLLTLSPNPQLVEFRSEKDYPTIKESACHIQGIQTFDLSNADFVLSDSNFKANGDSSTGTFNGQLFPVGNNAIDEVWQSSKFGHLGGIQAHGNILLVPFAVRDHKNEDQTKDPKQLSFFEVDWDKEGETLTQVSCTNINPGPGCTSSQDEETGSDDYPIRDAQAAGFVALSDTERLVFVLVEQTELKYNTLNKVDSIKDACKCQNNNKIEDCTEFWTVDPTNWNGEPIGDGQKPQAINLFYDAGVYYMISFRNANLGEIKRDAVGVYTFNLIKDVKDPDVYVVEDFSYVGSFYLNGENMRRAGGLNIFNDTDFVISSFGKLIKKGKNTISTYSRRVY